MKTHSIRRIEAWLQNAFSADVDFECDDALAKLDRLDLLRRDGDSSQCRPLDEALVRLDRIWDDFFPFDANEGILRRGPASAADQVIRPRAPKPLQNRHLSIVRNARQ